MALDVTLLMMAVVATVSYLIAPTIARECSDTWILGTSLDITSSKMHNANVSFTRIYLAKDTAQCGNDCCLELHGPCDLAEFRESKTKHTCLLYQCSPIERCKFKRENDSEVYMVSISATENQSLSYMADTLPPPENEVESTHGDGTKSKPRKGALPDELPADDLPLKHDNTTIVPRKGVTSVRDPVDTQFTNISAAMEGQDAGLDGKDSDLEIVTEHSSNILPLKKQSETSVALPSVSFPSTTLPQWNAYNDGVLNSSKTSNPFNVEPVLIANKTVPQLHERVYSNGRVVQVFQSTKTIMEVHSYPVNKDLPSKWHLVIGILLGLVVLVTVIGFLGKKIYDSWMTRHYRKMDFLVEGMYHGAP